MSPARLSDDDDICPMCESDHVEQQGGWCALLCLDCGYEWSAEDETLNEECRRMSTATISKCYR